MRLVSLELKNFQAHEKVVVELSPTITTIKGPTDVGKSSIIRALRWLALNDIAGEEFITEGEKTTTVTVELTEDKDDVWIHTIIRTRSTGGSTNTYELDDKEFKSFSTSVPADVAKLLQLNEINFQGQHDSPFWFNETAGEVSRRLNAVIDLSVIDQVLSAIASMVRTAQERKALTDERLIEAKAELDKMLPQRARVEQFKELKGKHERFITTAESHSRLGSIIGRVRECRDRQRKFEEKAEDGRSVLKDFREVLDLSAQSEELVEMLENAERLQAAAVPPPSFSLVESLHDQLTEAHVVQERLARLVSLVAGTLSRSVEWVERLRLADQRFHAQTKGKDCPLCQRPLP